ncbi:MAG: type II secretion system protein GspK [Acetobacteraceae bacterium]|nr:general secretion pathway protein GspK [Pseudomonadota bacterium]
MYDRGGERGLALIVALWGGAILAVVVMSVLQLTRADARLIRGTQDVAELNAIADAAVNMTILAMLGPPPTRPTINTGPATVTFAGVPVQVTLMDESGKIDVNLAGARTLRQVLSVAGMDPGQAEPMAEQIVAMRTPASGGAPFSSVEALQRVPGLTPAVYRRMAPMLTVYSQSAWIDPTYASLESLNAFRAFDSGADAAWRRLVEERTRSRGSTQKPSVVLGHAFTIVAEAVAGDVRVTRVAVIRLTGQPRSPLLIYRWH